MATLIFDETTTCATEYLHNKGYFVKIREDKDRIDILKKGTKVAEIVYLLESEVCYFLSKSPRKIQSCDLRKKNMLVEFCDIAAIVVVSSVSEGIISFSIFSETDIM